MKMTFDVTYEDGRKFTAIAKPKDFVAFERQYGKSIGTFGVDTPLEWVYYLAWSPLHRTRQEPGDFDTFLDAVDDVSPVADEETPAAAADPSMPTPTPDESAP